MGAIVTVPIAEELAFRAFIMRRLISPEFDAVALTRWTVAAIAVSSLAFGLMHGSRWIGGTVAGLLYAAVMVRRGRLSDAITAHAVTNALLAVWVLSRGEWQFW